LLAAPSGIFLRVRLPEMQRHIMARPINRYPWIFYCWIAYFVRNAVLFQLSFHAQPARIDRRCRKPIDSLRYQVFRENESDLCSSGISMIGDGFRSEKNRQRPWWKRPIHIRR
jgi:hypothetical protein